MTRPITAPDQPTPRLSIIVPVLNESSTIGACLNALQPLQEAGAEVIVVDGGSHDATVTLAAPLADRVLHGPRGRARQMNLGARDSRGRQLLFLHADTRLPAGADQAIDEALSSGACWGRFAIHIERAFALAGLVSTGMNLRSRWTGIATGDQALFMTREAYTQVGGFPDQPLMEDIALSRRLKRLSAPACLTLKVSTSARRWQQHGPVRTILRMWGWRLRYWAGTPADTLAREYDDAR